MKARKSSTSLELIVSLAPILLLLLFVPQFRSAVLIVASVLALGLVIFIINKVASSLDLPQPTTDFTLPPQSNTSSRPVLSEPRKSVQARLREIDWFKFEKVVEAVFRSHGYLVKRRGGANPDRGVDMVVEKDGRKSIVQCKHWKWQVDVKSMREFLGTLTDHRIEKGIFVTMKGFTKAAEDLAQKHGIELWNEVDLVKMIGEPNPAVQGILDDERKICPRCEREMVLRTAQKGRSAGNQFWGCSGYPRCKFIWEL